MIVFYENAVEIFAAKQCLPFTILIIFMCNEAQQSF